MNIINQFISNYGLSILSIIITGLISYIGLGLKKVIHTLVIHKIKTESAEMVYHATEELYKNLNPKEKYTKMMTYLQQILKEKNINISTLEINLLLYNIIHKKKEGDISECSNI